MQTQTDARVRTSIKARAGSRFLERRFDLVEIQNNQGCVLWSTGKTARPGCTGSGERTAIASGTEGENFTTGWRLPAATTGILVQQECDSCI